MGGVGSKVAHVVAWSGEDQRAILENLGSGCGATLEGLDKGQGGSRGVKWVAKVEEGG